MSDNEKDEFYMRKALQIAQQAFQIGEVPVGCVIVLPCKDVVTSFSKNKNVVEKNTKEVVGVEKNKDFGILSFGANMVNATRDATRHAEIVAIDRLLTGTGRCSDELQLFLPFLLSEDANDSSKKYYDSSHENRPNSNEVWRWTPKEAQELSILQECCLYVTCEPCIMCAAALKKVRIKKVVFGCHNNRFGGCGSILNLHRSDESNGKVEQHGYEIVSGVLANEAISLLRSFYNRENLHAPEDKRKKKYEKANETQS